MLPYFVHETLRNELNSCKHAKFSFALLAVSMRNQEQKSRVLLQSYPEVFNRPLHKFLGDQAIAENDALALMLMPLSSITLKLYVDAIIDKS